MVPAPTLNLPWLNKLDSSPSVAPTWPSSSSLALVQVEKGKDGLRFHVITSAAELDREVDPQYGPNRLYFLIPKATLYEYVDGLEPSSFT